MRPVGVEPTTTTWRDVMLPLHHGRKGQKSGFEPDSTHSQRVVFPLHHICTPHTGIEPVSRPSRGRMLSDTPIGQHPIRELNPSQLVRSQLCCPIHQWGMGLKRLELSSCDLESHCFPISDSPYGRVGNRTRSLMLAKHAFYPLELPARLIYYIIIKVFKIVDVILFYNTTMSFFFSISSSFSLTLFLNSNARSSSHG